MLHGAPGTGKTMFAKALAYYSGLDYALTSGSEFAKITDTNQAIKELRKLIDWADKSPNGVIIFVDEAESFLADRTLPTTTKWAQDMLNAFLSAVPKPTSDKVMFVFATNHPFKLDKAVLSRVGEKVEFKLPAQPEREKLLSFYLGKFSKEKAVKLDAEFLSNISKMAKNLEGIAPREIEYIAEKMVDMSRGKNGSVLTLDIAEDVAALTRKTIEASQQWDKERQKWVEQQVAAVHAV